MIITEYKHKRGTASKWEELNPILPDGLIAIEKGSPPKLKIGDGVTAWNDLPYFENNTPIQTALLSQDFTGEFNLSIGDDVYYKPLTLDTSLTPTVTSVQKEGSACRLLINAGLSASLNTLNMGTPEVFSEDFIPGKKNLILIYIVPEGINGTLIKKYIIKPEY